MQLHPLAVLDPGRHLFWNLGDHLQRVDPHDRHHRHLVLDQLAEVDQALLDVAIERCPDLGVAQLPVGELHARFRCLNARAQVLRVLQRQVVAGLLRLQRRRGVVERLLRDERALEELVRTVVGLPGLREIRVGFLHVGRLLGVGQVLGVGGAQLCKCALERRFLLVEIVLLFLAIDLDERLSGGHPIAEIGQDPAHLPVGFRRNRDLIHSGKRADHLHGPADRFLADDLDLDRLGGSLAAVRLSAFGFRASCNGQSDQRDDRADPASGARGV